MPADRAPNKSSSVPRHLFGAARLSGRSAAALIIAIVALLLGAGALLLGGSAAHAGASAARTCKSTGVRDVAADVRGRLYADRRDNWYACLRSRNRPVQIAEETVDVYSPLVTSPFAALVTQSITRYRSTDSLNVADMRNGRVATRDVDSGIADLVLTRRGVAAFILAPSEDIDGNPIGTPRVQKLEREGKLTELDVGNIDLQSLAVSRDGRHLYWTRDGVARTATL